MTDAVAPTVSVVVNTLDRADALDDLIAALRHQTHPAFEVVVVAGPCRDHTEAVLARHADVVKVRRCAERNLSMSRNIGIAAAAGDIVAFIDDDGVPEPFWLEELVAGYTSWEVAAVGGVVHDHTGHGFQTRFIRCDRHGAAEYSDTRPFDDLSFPGARWYPSLLGCNSSFRRDALVGIGGFDEEFEYYLDETDVCVRLIDAGWIVRQLPGAPVLHKFLPSSVRATTRVVLDNYPIVKNAIYFAFVNGRDHLSDAELFEGVARFSRSRSDDLRYHAATGTITQAQLDVALERIDAAWEPGMAAGRRGRAVCYDPAAEAVHGGPFLPFPTVRPDGRRLRLCLVTQTLPPEVPGGIGRYVLDLGRELGRRGHDVRIITRTDGHPTVDLEGDVWVHRIPSTSAREVPPHLDGVPAPVWARAAAVADEVLRIQGEAPVDVVYAPIWDAEGLALAPATATLTLTSLMTTMGISLADRPAWRDDAAFMASLGDPLHRLERRQLATAHGLHAISSAIVDAIEAASDVEIDDRGLFTSHLGAPDLDGSRVAPAPGPPRVLFVGRFERRKGVDLLLEAAPTILGAHPSVELVLVGRDDLPDGSGSTYREAFEARHAAAPWLERVRFLGEVDDDAVADAYRDATVLVAPSRFESFGLIYVEAMRAGVPVVALRRGAAAEVLADGSDAGAVAELVEPDPDELAAAVVALLDDPPRRAAMAAAARRRYEARFTVGAMADAVERDLRSTSTLRRDDPLVDDHDGTPIRLPDHSTGVLLRPDAAVAVGPLPAGRCTLVLHAVAGSTAAVEVDGRPVGSEWAEQGFVHVTLPAGATTCRVTGDGGAAFAALHVVPGRGRRP